MTQIAVSAVYKLAIVTKTHLCLLPNFCKISTVTLLTKSTRRFSKITFNGASQKSSMDTDIKSNDATKIFEAAVSAVSPHDMIKSKVQFQEDNKVLKVENKEYDINKNVFVVGFGKAVIGMARAVEDILKEHIQTGIISVPHGALSSLQNAGKSEMLLKRESRIQMFEGARNNLPDSDACETAHKIEKLAKSLTQSDILLVLISGGGSSLLPSPCHPITIEDELSVVEVLSKHAATIQQLNMVRKNIESLKGGGLALVAHPAQVISLIVSDVIGDPLDIIASGPTVKDPSTPGQCLDLFQTLHIANHVPSSIVNFLNSQRLPSVTQKSHDWSMVQNLIVGCNTIAASGAAHKASILGYIPQILTTTLDGEAKHVGPLFVHLAKYASMVFKSTSKSERNPAMVEFEFNLIKMGVTKSQINELVCVIEKCCCTRKGLCVISGGETTVQIKGSGIGGRNQEMVLAAALAFEEIENEVRTFDIQFLSAGTDGQDGPTDLAGAVIQPNFAKLCTRSGINLHTYLINNDSNTLFSKFRSEGVLVETGLTGTNVMDIQVLIVKPKEY